MASNDRQILANLVKRAQNGDRDPLRPLIDDYLIRREGSKKRYRSHTFPIVSRFRPGGRLSPSTIGGCPRMAAFKFLGTPGRKTLDPDLEGIFDDGNWRHHRWQATWHDMQQVLGKKRMQVLSTEAAVTYAPLLIAGNSDNVLRINRTRGVLDIKGIQDYGFTEIYTKDEPKSEHVSQILSYMKCHNAVLGWLHYENKNNNRTRTFVIKWDEDRWRWIEQWCQSVIRALRQRRLPPMSPDCDAGNYLYEKCPWSYLCYGQKDTRQIESEVFIGFPGPKKAYKESLKGRE